MKRTAEKGMSQAISSAVRFTDSDRFSTLIPAVNCWATISPLPRTDRTTFVQKLMKTILLFLLASLAHPTLSHEADSAMRCFNHPKSVKVTLKQSAAVFSGQVLEVKNGGTYIEARFRVNRSWKGVEAEEVTVLTDRTTESPHYRVGEKYLVFAYTRDGKLFTGSCSRTKKVEYAKEDLEQLGGDKGRAGNSSIEPEKQVRAFVEAFNARDIDGMLALADENVQWLSVDGAKISVETEGKAALRESMTRYFRSCPTCKSSLEWIQRAGSRVTAMERANWTGKSGAKSQSGLSVYEFGGDKILRVYYFPAEVDKVPAAIK